MNISNTNSSLIPKDTAVYLRLSEEEKHKRISDSIDNQKVILLDYANKLNLNVIKIYADEHFTGSTFNRPVFKEMIKDIEKGLINCVLVKDLSRLGREHNSADYYLEKYFPSKGVRFISFRGRLDSFLDPERMNDIDIPLENALNEETVKHTSAITKATLKIMQKDGKYMTGRPPYGYLKDPTDKHKLIIDKCTYKNVEIVFSTFMNGNSLTKIARNLNENNVISPASHFHKLKHGKTKAGSKWTGSVVRGILNKSTLYAGNMEQGKTFAFNHKVKKRFPLPKDKWIFVADTHEPIIDKATDKLVQEMIKKMAKPSSVKSRQSSPVVFASLVYCKECGKPMTTTSSKYKDKKSYRKFICSSYKKFGKDVCGSHLIYEQSIYDCVLVVLNKLINNLLDVEKAMLIQEKHQHEKAIAKLNHKIDNAKNESKKFQELKLGLYGDFKDNILSLNDYKYMSEKYNKTICDLDKAIDEMNKQKEDITSGKANSNDHVDLFKSYKGISKIDRMLAIKLIDKIIVDKDKNIEVCFKFSDPLKQYMSY